MRLDRVLAVLLFGLASLNAAAESVTVVAEDDWYPYCADKGGKPEGFAVDIVRESFKAAGVDVVFKIMPYARCMDTVKKGTEIACFDSTWLPEYDASYLKPKQQLFDAEIAIYAPVSYKGKMDLKVPDLAGKMVGITNGYEYGAEFGANKAIKTDAANSDLLSLKKLAAGRTEFGLYYSKVYDSLVKENAAELAGKTKRVGTVTVDKLYLSFSRKHPAAPKAMAQFEKGLAAIRSNGSYKKIEDSWAAKLR